MKNLSLKNKILAGIAAALVLVIFAFLIWTIVAVAVGNRPAPAIVDNTEYDFTFDGKITLNEVEYDVKLNGKDEKFSVNANKIQGVVTGAYQFTEGQGYTLSFSDSANTVVRTQFDTASKTFGFFYHLDMGSRGAGNLKFTMMNEEFHVVGEPWKDIPSLAGPAGFFGGTLVSTCTCACDAEGNFSIFTSNGAAAIQPINGTYAFADGQYVFTAENGTAYTTVTNADGLYELKLQVFCPQLAAYGPVAYAELVLTQVVLTVD